MVRATHGGNTRDGILHVALELFAKQGYSGTSIRDIAERMHLTKAAVYYHFPSKESLLADVLTPAMARVREVLDAAEPVRTAQQRKDLVTAIVEVVAEIGPQIVMMLSDPAVGTNLRTIAGDNTLPQQVGETLLGPLPEDPREASACRIRAACAVGCLPAGIDAWRRENPEASTLDDDTKAVLVQTVLAVIEPEMSR